MKKQITRILALILCAVMILGMVPMIAHAADDSRIITNMEELKAVLNEVDPPEGGYRLIVESDEPFVLTESVEIPWGFWLQPFTPMIIPEGVCLTVLDSFHIYSEVTVYGEVNAPKYSYVWIGGDFGGCLKVAEGAKADINYIHVDAPIGMELSEVIQGIDLTEYSFYEESGEDMYSWFLTKKGAEEEPEAVPGDMTGDEVVDDSDVAHLLWHTLFPNEYEVSGEADFNGDGAIDDADVAYLLWHTLFPDAYPL
ncbi:MAG: hypothetical protein J6B95_08980 [Oscillospiraceae bacterium]|nr:hypothetical protein [Oscillospiraceae bacterium]